MIEGCTPGYRTRIVKEDVGEKISASGRGYTSTWQQNLQRTENSGRTLWGMALDDDDDTYWTYYYTVSHKKRATLFLVITPAFLVDFYTFCTSRNGKKYSTIHLFNGLMTS